MNYNTIKVYHFQRYQLKDQMELSCITFQKMMVNQKFLTTMRCIYLILEGNTLMEQLILQELFIGVNLQNMKKNFIQEYYSVI